MKVLITHERFAPDFAGGGEYVVLQTARHLQRAGVDVRVLTTGDPSITDYEGIKTHRLPIHPYRFNLAASQVADFAADVDLIQTFNYHACLPSLRGGRETGKPVVCMILGLFREAWKEMRGPIVGRMFMAQEQFLLTREYDRLIFLSEFSRRMAVKQAPLNSPTSIISPAIELQNYAPADPKEDVVLFVGKVDVRKGIDDFLAVATALPQVRFRIFGWPGNGLTLKSSAPDNVEWVEAERGPKLWAEFSRARIFFFPSRAETFGIVLLEAMASGCAIISTIPLGYEGIQVQPGDRESMIDAVSRLWQNPTETAQMGKSNIQRSRPYTWESYIRSLLDTYEQILARGSST
ncbi:MAG: glycosyltransferase family 4 protein [Phycisphaerales bacterium]|nr:MAG: glycosyltransferase family 4 protein [Phycisphaerales bacterium]